MHKVVRIGASLSREQALLKRNAWRPFKISSKQYDAGSRVKGAFVCRGTKNAFIKVAAKFTDAEHYLLVRHAGSFDRQ